MKIIDKEVGNKVCSVGLITTNNLKYAISETEMVVDGTDFVFEFYPLPITKPPLIEFGDKIYRYEVKEIIQTISDFQLFGESHRIIHKPEMSLRLRLTEMKLQKENEKQDKSYIVVGQFSKIFSNEV